MSNFAPKCPNCHLSDEVINYREEHKFYTLKYYCKRCRRIFDAEKGFPPNTASFYQATPHSISGSDYFVTSGP